MSGNTTVTQDQQSQFETPASQAKKFKSNVSKNTKKEQMQEDNRLKADENAPKMLQQISYEWKQMTPNEKKIYEDLEKQDKERYEREFQQFKNQGWYLDEVTKKVVKKAEEKNEQKGKETLKSNKRKK